MGSFMRRMWGDKALGISLFVLFLYLVPFFVLGPGIPVLVHDNLDEVFVWYKVLAESGTIIAPLDQTIPNFMGGLPRNVLVGASEFSLVVWLFALFDPFAVYLINIVVMHLAAFAGMFFLLKSHFLKGPGEGWLVSGVALCFALLPFWPLGQLSIAGLPLALNSFLHMRNGVAKKRHWLPLLLLPLYASFVYSFLFFLAGMALIWLYDLVKKRKLNWPFLAAAILMAALFIAVEYRLFFNMFFDSGFQSHRLEFFGYPGGIVKIILRAGRSFLFGVYHAASLHLPFLFAAAAIAAIVAFFRRGQQTVSGFAVSKAGKSLFAKLVVLLALISLFDEAVSGWDLLLPLKEAVPFLRTFTLGRFKFLFPLIWFILFALSLKTIAKKASYGKRIAIALIILQAGFLFSITGNEFQSGGLGLFLSRQPSFSGFHSVGLFGEIDAFIGLPKESYRVVSIGLHPSVSQFNGFHTLDSYQTNYPLGYKHRFRRVIEKELEKSESLRQYFDWWGGRCYVFPAELGGNAMQTKDRNGVVKNLELNTQALRELGAGYIFSAVEIENAEENSLALLRTFERQDSIWRIRLYRIE